jgi:hypothetical protein
MKDGTTRPLTTLYIADGPPKAFMTIQCWNLGAGAVLAFEQLLQQSVNITKIRCMVDKERGNTFETIGLHSRMSSCKNPDLETWWFKPLPVAKQPDPVDHARNE